MRLSLRGFSIGLMSFLLLLISIYTGSVLLFSTSISLLLILTRARIQIERILRVSNRIHVRRSIERYRVYEGGETEIKIYVENRSENTIPYLVVADMIPRELKVSGGSNQIASILSGNSFIEYSYKVRVDNPGRHDIRSIKLILGDSLALFLEEIYVDYYSYITGIPRSIPIDISEKIRSLNPGSMIRGRTLGGIYDLWGFREYTPGDDVRKIYWKGFARTGKVYVREDIGESRPRTLLIIGLTKYSWLIGSGFNSYSEALLRLARSVGEVILNSYGSLDVMICEEAVVKIFRNITSKTRERFLSLFDEIPYRGGCSSIGIILLNLYRAGEAGYDLVLITSTPVDLITSDPGDIIRYARESGFTGVIMMPNLDYEKDIGEGIVNIISRTLSSAGFPPIILDRSFKRVS
ncbi:MAG: DUF58 domain-containing protein [Sulfolobales archaeon]